jgi:plasmid stabilization system protein ParE
MTYRLEITRRAAADRDTCFDFIFERSTQRALRWLDEFDVVSSVRSFYKPECRTGESPSQTTHSSTTRNPAWP